LTIVGIPFALYLGAGWTLCWQLVVLEGLSGRASLRRSGVLVKGHRWRVSGVLLLVSIVYFALTSIPSILVGAAIGGLDGSQPVRLAPHAVVINSLVATVALSACYPLLAIAFTVLYYELRVRKEALDLEVLAGGSDHVAA
jgi:hypothetical protein